MERSRSFTRRVDAERFKATTEADRIRGQWTDPRLGQTRFADWCRHWHGSRIHITSTTRARDSSILDNHVLPAFGNLPHSAIQPTHIRSWIADLVAAGYAATTVRKAHQLLAAAMTAAVDDGLLPRSPAHNIRLPPPDSQERRFLSEDQVEALATAIDPRYRVLVLFGAYTGTRLGEMTRLGVDDLDLVRRVAHIPGTKTPTSRRTIALPPFLGDELARHLAHHGPGTEGHVFPSPGGDRLHPTNFRRRIWKPAVAASVGEPMRPHDLRHTHVALLIAAAEDPYVISQRLGHASIRTTYDIYGHLFEGRDEATAHALEQIRRRALAGQTRDRSPGRAIELGP